MTRFSVPSYDHGGFGVMMTLHNCCGREMLDQELMDRFDAKISKDVSGCWLWTGAKSKAGYGQIRATRKRLTLYAHRVAVERWKGQVPDGMEVCHSCDVRNCVNPDHMFFGTRADNLRDMRKKDRHIRGERTCNAVLRDAAVREIRRKAGRVSNRSIAVSLGVCHTTIDRVVNRETWKHIS